MHLTAGYLTDSALREELNGQGRNYWWAYIAEVVDRLGLTAEAIEVAELSERLPGLAVLFVGGTRQPLPSGEIEGWVRSGGVLIGSACDRLDDLFAVDYDSTLEQTEGEFTVNGELYLGSTSFTDGIHSPLYPDAPLLAASDIRLVRSRDCEVLAECEGRPVITARKLGRGWAFYFGFDLGQTFWVIQQGRPVDRDWDGDGMWRTVDMVVTAGYAQDIPYTDELLLLLQNMVGVVPIPVLHQLPHDNGRIPDFALYFGGDDEGASDVQVPASRFMAERKLPYHINCMAEDGEFGLDADRIRVLRGLGAELSLHYNYITGFDPMFAFSESDVRSQTEAYRRHFGTLPVCAVSHVVRWTGWAEPAIWMSEAGVRGDNSYAHVRSNVVNPINTVGFAFGTSYPFHFWSDSTRSNSRIEFVELPITGYEIGYDGDEDDFGMVDKCLALAEHYQSTLSFFYHPIYIANFAACRRAIDYLIGRLSEGYPNVLLTSSDALVTWWSDRSATRIADASFGGGRLSFSVSTPAPQGVVVKISLGDYATARTNNPSRLVERYGRRWLLVAVGQGDSLVDVELA